MSLTRITAPSEPVVTLSAVKEFLRVDNTADDATIEHLLTAAERRYDAPDGLLGRALVTQTWELRRDTFPSGAIEVPLPPLQSVASVTYEARDGSIKTLAAGTDYRVDTYSEPGRIVPVASWPRTADVPSAVVVEFVAGFGDAGAVPYQIQTAIMQTVASWFDTSRASVAMDGGRPREVPHAGDDLAREYRIEWGF
jgi:uncharacterized phiE125 gp8 family phage protein